MEGSVDRCIKCGSCQRACPVLNQVSERRFPGPRTLAVDVSRSPGMSAMHDMLWTCSICEACSSVCPSGVALPQALLSLRRRLMDPGRVSEGHARLFGNIDRYGLSIEPSVPRKVLNDAHADICYFPGCIAQERTRETLDAAIAILRAMGRKVAVPTGLKCCGSPLRKIGDLERAEKCMQHNLDILSRYDHVVTSCPGCTGELVKQYDLDAMHLVEYLTEVVGTSGMRFTSKGPRRIGLHAACHLERGIGAHTTEETWQLLGSLPDVTLVELDDVSVCCGAGGGLMSGSPELASTMAKRKIKTARQNDVGTLVTACPFCVTNLRRAGDMDVAELGQMLWSSLSRPGQS